MKKIAIMLTLLLAVGAAPGWCLNATVDGFIEDRANSDIAPIRDTGEILRVANDSVDATYDVITGPIDPVLNPVRTVRDETVRHTKKVINYIWDTVTFRSIRE